MPHSAQLYTHLWLSSSLQLGPQIGIIIVNRPTTQPHQWSCISTSLIRYPPNFKTRFVGPSIVVGNICPCNICPGHNCHPSLSPPTICGANIYLDSKIVQLEPQINTKLGFNTTTHPPNHPEFCPIPPIVFWTKNFVGPKIFLEQHFLLTKHFWSKKIWSEKIFNP